MSLYVTRNPHKTALRRHHYDSVQPAEKQRHPSDAVWHGGMRLYYLTLTAVAIAFSCGWVAL